MTDVFLSYSRQNLHIAEKLASYLSDSGFSVWWDEELRAGDRYAPVIESALREAKSVVVIWSNESITSDWVRDEATEGLRRGILIPLVLKDVIPPLEFRNIQTLEITEWLNDYNHPVGQKLIDAVALKISKRSTDLLPSSSSPSLSEMRSRLFMAKSPFDLKAGLYDVKAFLAKHPYNTEAHLLLDQYEKALEVELRYVRAPAPSPFLRKGCLIGLAVQLLAFIILYRLLGFALFYAIGIAVIISVGIVLLSFLLVRVFYLIEKIKTRRNK